MKLFRVANRYCEESNWKTLATLKFCLLALGLTIGALMPKKARVPVACGAVAVFVATYLPLMGKFFALWRKDAQEQAYPED